LQFPTSTPLGEGSKEICSRQHSTGVWNRKQGHHYMNFTILEETIYQSSDVNELEERISQSGI
jgi:hypothetical protein